VISSSKRLNVPGLVTAFESGRAALESLRTDSADVLVSDIGMPEFDGYDLIAALRHEPDGPPLIPAVMLTAFARTEDRDRIVAAGYQLHLPKPFTGLELLDAVVTCVNAPLSGGTS
jgi:CheY-like chemotaxis protein